MKRFLRGIAAMLSCAAIPMTAAQAATQTVTLPDISYEHDTADFVFAAVDAAADSGVTIELSGIVGGQLRCHGSGDCPSANVLSALMLSFQVGTSGRWIYPYGGDRYNAPAYPGSAAGAAFDVVPLSFAETVFVLDHAQAASLGLLRGAGSASGARGSLILQGFQLHGSNGLFEPAGLTGESLTVSLHYTAAVPEPGSASLAALGLLAASAAVRRRKETHAGSGSAPH